MNESKPKIGVIDYGVGNLFSVQNALRGLHCSIVMARDPGELEGVKRVILPGVGAFKEGMDKLHATGFARYIHTHTESGGYLLGICLGMQLLLSCGEEGGQTEGLGLVSGGVKKMNSAGAEGCRIPHIGWNEVYGQGFGAIRLFDGIEQGSSFYFVHSYQAVPEEDIDIVYTDFCGQDIVAGFRKDRIYGMQFHPEKSQTVGLKLLTNFLALDE